MHIHASVYRRVLTPPNGRNEQLYDDVSRFYNHPSSSAVRGSSYHWGASLWRDFWHNEEGDTWRLSALVEVPGDGEDTFIELRVQRLSSLARNKKEGRGRGGRGLTLPLLSSPKT